MARFSNRSRRVLDTCHPDLIRLAEEAIKYFDFAVVTGHRTIAEQQRLYAKGRTEPGPIVTKVDGVRKIGRHNRKPAEAFDFVPYIQETNAYDWNNRERFAVAGGLFLGIASQMDLVAPIRWGGNWDMDDQYNEAGDDWDLPHIEILIPH